MGEGIGEVPNRPVLTAGELGRGPQHSGRSVGVDSDRKGIERQPESLTDRLHEGLLAGPEAIERVDPGLGRKGGPAGHFFRTEKPGGDAGEIEVRPGGFDIDPDFHPMGQSHQHPTGGV